MTPQQLATLRAYIDSVPAWSALPNNSESADVIARALNAEAKVLSAGAGTTASPATMGYEGNVNYADVQEARSI